MDTIIKKKESIKKKLISQRIKKISFLVLGIINALFAVALCVLVSVLSPAVIGTLGFTIGVSALSSFNSVLLFLAKSSDKISEICEKYGLLNDQFEIKLSNLGDFVKDISELKSEIQSLKSENLNLPYGSETVSNSNDPPILGETQPPLPTGRSVFTIQKEMNTPRFKTRYDTKTDTIFIEYDKNYV